jgi:MFS transporter, DHA2 family, multidrug resistance protein
MHSIDGVPLPKRYWAIATTALGVTMAVIDSTIANVALPTIANDLNADASFSVWVVNGYQLAITMSLLPLAALGDNVGYRRIYIAGLAVFTAASLACSLSHSLVALALARVTQGFGAAGIMSVNTALVRFIYPHRLLGRGIGINALVVAIASAAGPTLASGILSVASWPWLFAVNVPIGIAACIIGTYALPKTPRAPHPFDFLGACLSAAMFGLLIGGIEAAGHGERGLLFAAEMIAATAVASVLVRRELARPAPLLPVDLLRIPIFALSIGTSILAFAAQMLVFVALPFQLQREFGFSAVATGLLVTPWPLALAVIAPIAGRLADRYPAGILGALGLTVLSVGLLALAFLRRNPDFVDVAWRMAACGVGFGIFLSPNSRTIIAAAPRKRSGGASGMMGTARLLGQTTGAALVALLLGRIPLRATTAALFIGAGFAALAALVSASRLFGGPSTGALRPEPAERDGNRAGQ